MIQTINVICGLVTFVYCTCRLGARVHSWRSLNFWGHLCLLTGAVAIITTHETASVQWTIFQVGSTLYFSSQTYRIWRLQHITQGK